jgi:hypothetical protein
VNPADLVLVDGHNLLWMAAMGTPASVSSRDGNRDLTGVFMFFALLRKAIWENFTSRPETLIVFDGELGSAGRKAVDPGYKANRPQETPAAGPETAGRGTGRPPGATAGPHPCTSRSATGIPERNASLRKPSRTLFTLKSMALRWNRSHRGRPEGGPDSFRLAFCPGPRAIPRRR